MVRAFIFTAAVCICTWAVSGQAEAFHGHRARCGSGYATPVAVYYAPARHYAPARYSGYYRATPTYSSAYRGYGYRSYRSPGYGYVANPYGYPGYRTGRISIGIGSGLGYGGLGRYGGYGGYGGYGYR